MLSLMVSQLVTWQDTAHHLDSDYCIETQLVRMCTEGGDWEGATPTVSRGKHVVLWM